MKTEVKELAAKIQENQDKIAAEIDDLRERHEEMEEKYNGLKELEVEDINKKIDEFEEEYSKTSELLKNLTDEMEHQIITSEEEEKKAKEEQAYLKFMTKGMERMSRDERNYLEKATGDAGAYWVAPNYREELIQELLNVSKLRNLVTSMDISGDSLEMPKDGTTFTITWGGRSLPEKQNVTDGTLNIPIYTARALAMVSEDMVEDTAIDLEGHIKSKLADAIAKEDDDVILGGNGDTQPEGLIKNSDVNSVATEIAATLTYDDVIDLIYDLHEYYAADASVIAMRKIVRELRKLKDGNGRYLWERPSGGEPASIDTLPLVQPYTGLDETIATGNTIMTVGDFKYYYLLNRKRLSLKRIDNSPTYLPNIGLYFRYRQGGKVVQSNAFRKLEVS